MKKKVTYIGLLFLMIFFVGIMGVHAEEYGIIFDDDDTACVERNTGSTTYTTCPIKAKVTTTSAKYTTIVLTFIREKVEIDSVTGKNGWTVSNRSGDTYTFTYNGTSAPVGTSDIADVQYHKTGGANDNCALNINEPKFEENKSCKVEGNNYYNKSGISVSKEAYEEDCGLVKCEYRNGNYYDKDGNKTTEEGYVNSCNPKCEIVNGKYYDKDGKKVEKEDYDKSCGQTEIIKCEYKDGKYYDKSGKEVTEEEYAKSCNPKCKIVNGKYYDSKGNEVTEAKWNEVCKNPVNPKTGTLSVTLFVFAGIIGLLAYGFISKKDKLY